MTLKELQEKNARIRAEREAAKAFAKAVEENEPAQPTIQPVEETPHVAEMQSEEAPVEEELVVENPVPEKKKKAKKPANREYMVVEQIPEE